MSDVRIIVSGFSTDSLTVKGDLIPKENPNVCINGNFDIWQTGSSFTYTTSGNGAYTADMMKIWHNGTGSRTISKQQFNSIDRISGIAGGSHPSYYLRYNKTAASTGSNNSPTYWGGNQLNTGILDTLHLPIENIFTLTGTVTFSCWVRPNQNITVQPYLVQFWINPNERVYNKLGLGGTTTPTTDWSGNYTQSLIANQWNLVTFTCILDSNIGFSDINLETGGIACNLGLPNLTGLVLDTTGWCLEKGNIVTQKTNRTMQQELALCQRYYEKSYDVNITPGTAGAGGPLTTQNFGGNTSAGTILMSWNFKVQKRISPTLTAYSPNTGTSGKFSVQSSGDYNVSIAGGTTNAYATNSVSIPNGYYAIYMHGVADSRM